MKHVHRFHITPGVDLSPEISLSPEEAHHALSVVRVQCGDAVELFDGSGLEIVGRISSVTRRAVVIHPESERRIPRGSVCLELLQAWLHREKSTEFIVQRATELGVHRVVFFRGQHSQGTPRIGEKLRRVATESCKQCGRAWIPELAAASDLESALKQAPHPILVATRHAAPSPMRDVLRSPRASLLVGPEGDFTDTELDHIVKAGAVAISLGEVTYRSEIAATIGMTIVRYEMEHPQYQSEPAV
jgi:16S rRNA (uracil1498-N3)-methyltransferase